ncbi:unnamed protein product, partial [Didymodactylos carnosus]
DDKNVDDEVFGDEQDEEKDPKIKYSIPTSMCLQSVNPEDYADFDQNEIAVAPAEKYKPASLFTEKDLKAKAFPHLFPEGINTYHSEHKQKLTIGLRK